MPQDVGIGWCALKLEYPNVCACVCVCVSPGSLSHKYVWICALGFNGLATKEWTVKLKATPDTQRLPQEWQ